MIDMPTSISIFILVFVCTFGGALTGIWIRTRLPQQHISDESKDTVKLGIGLVATTTALLLGLVIASANSSFKDISTQLKQISTDVLTLDRALARYGSETDSIRQDLKTTLGERIKLIWPEESSQAAVLEPMSGKGESIVDRIYHLTPKNDEQRWFKAHALELGENLLGNRWLMLSGVSVFVPKPLIIVLIFWLTVIFMSFGLFAPRNATVITTLFVCAISVSTSVFLVVEMEQPFDGLIKVSPATLNYAYTHINQ